MYEIVWIFDGARVIDEVTAPTMRAARVKFREDGWPRRDAIIVSIRRAR